MNYRLELVKKFQSELGYSISQSLDLMMKINKTTLSEKEAYNIFMATGFKDAEQFISNKPVITYNSLKNFNRFLLKVFLVIVILTFGLITYGCGTQEDKPVPVPVAKIQQEIKEESHQKWITKQFSGWDGRHTRIVQLIKPKLNDPSSFEHVETRYSKQGDDIIVFMTYCAKNQYGGVVMGNVKAKVCYSNDAIEIM